VQSPTLGGNPPKQSITSQPILLQLSGGGKPILLQPNGGKVPVKHDPNVNVTDVSVDVSLISKVHPGR
jgi:hypothetical protein